MVTDTDTGTDVGGETGTCVEAYQTVPAPGETAPDAKGACSMSNNPLVRSPQNRLLGGVCGGIAQWLGWDATAVRILYVVVSVVSAAFPGVIVYLALWLLMPAEK